jgi:mannose-6-phosphate isomerase-like protein (cupin superfamily)
MPDWLINIKEMTEEHQLWSWGDGNYERYRREVSRALGSTKENHHPIDVELTRLPPGAKPCPIHQHAYWWEFFIIVSGHAAIHRNGEMFEARTGDCFVQQPGTLHRIHNASETEDLLYYVIVNEVDVKDSGFPSEI